MARRAVTIALVPDPVLCGTTRAAIGLTYKGHVQQIILIERAAVVVGH